MLAAERLRAYPDKLLENRVLKEVHRQDGKLIYVRVGIICPCNAKEHKQIVRGKRKVCKRWRNCGYVQTKKLGDFGPLCFLGAWADSAHLHATRSGHMRAKPTQAEMISFKAKQGW